MRIPPKIARIESSDFEKVLQFCAIGLVLTLMYMITAYLILGEWIAALPGE